VPSVSELDARAEAPRAAPGWRGRLRRVLDLVTRPPVLSAFAWLQAGAMLLMATHYLSTLSGPTDGSDRVITGDYPAFYTGAHLLHTGRGAELYDLQAQRSAQAALIGRPLASWQPYAYPPLLALALSPSAGLGYLAAFYLHAALMVAALLFLFWRLRPWLSGLCGTPRAWATTWLLIASWHPVTRTAIGGQNTVLSLALLAGFGAWIETGRPVLAGLCLGLLSYKPQLLPLLALCALLRRQRLALAIAAATALGHYLLGALFCGSSWPLAWLRMLVDYRRLEWASNRYNHVSLWALASQLLPSAWAPICAGAATLAVIALVARGALDPNRSWSAVFGLAVAGTALASPHMQYYDAALLLLPVLLGLDAQRRAGRYPKLRLRLLLACGYVGYPLYLYGARLGVQPWCVANLLVFVWLVAQPSATSSGAAWDSSCRRE
jgi:alpha-1,2-mannosyltransferase